MSDFIEISKDQVIVESQTTTPGYCDRVYLIYYNEKEKRQKIRINTYYYETNGMIKLCKHYDRGLCDTMEEYYNLSADYIESQAYGSYMDGAR